MSGAFFRDAVTSRSYGSTGVAASPNGRDLHAATSLRCLPSCRSRAV